MKAAAMAAMLAVAGAVVSLPAKADHEGRFDFTKTVTMSGVLAKLTWSNPRVYLYVDVANPEGKIEQWTVLTGNPTQLAKAGIADKTQLVIGGTFSLQANPELKGGTKVIFLTSLTFPDGKTVKLGM